MRGLSNGSTAGQGLGIYPNVAIYLDDQSGQLPSRNLDVYAADLERIEVLEGPQGTLFGAGAQAGVVRYITNKPKFDVTEGNVSASYGTTAGGDPNSAVTAVINLPVIPDTLAVRAVVYDDTRGGYINNVPSTFTRKASDLSIRYANYATACKIGAPSSTGLCLGTGNAPTAYGVPPDSVVANNFDLTGNAINPVTYQGIRASALYKINEDWTALLAQSYQSMNAQGVFYEMPNSSDGQPLPSLSVSLFTPSYNKDKFENTAWTVNGRIGDLKAVYTGAYLVRNVDQVQDYSNYSRGAYADYYQCHGATPSGSLKSTCYSPLGQWRVIERNTHQSQEMRLSTPDEWHIRGILGAFWEDQKIYDQTDWLYTSLPTCTTSSDVGCLTPLSPPPGSTANNPNIRNGNTSFFDDTTRGYTQYAFFTSIDYDLIPKVLTATAGTRYYHFDNTETGSAVSGFGCYQAGPAPCATEGATNLNAANLNSTYSGFKSRANLTWHVTHDVMLYYTWSQGFRPGGFNKAPTCHIPDASGVNLYCISLNYASDSLTNNEIGWKTEFFDRRFQWNGAVYQENWNNVQTNFYDPGELGSLGFVDNGPDYRIRGVETSIVARVTQGLTAQGSASWNSSSQTNSPFLIANNPALRANPATASEFGKPITSVANPYGPPGSPSANSPPMQFNIRLRYEWAISSYNAFAQVGATHTDHSYTQSGSNPTLSSGGAVSTTALRFENPAYSTYDASVGIAKDAWSVQVFGQNLTDVLASVFTSTTQFVESETVTRPRVLGARFTYKF